MHDIIRNENLEGTSWHRYQLTEQIVKIHVPSLDYPPAKTPSDSKKLGTTCRGYDFALVRLY